MTRNRRYKSSRLNRALRIFENRHIRIVGLIVVIATVASFYIYQRVWVRNLVDEVKELQDRNQRTGEYLAGLKSEWVSASSMANIETKIADLRLALVPTRPAQNFSLDPLAGQEPDRYAGLIKAFEKLKGSIPLVSSNEADASELFEEQ